METVSAGLTEGDVECFSEYMELWVHRMRIEGLRLWLSGALRIPVSLASLDDLNGKLSACGFSLYRDPDRNYVFRVLYSGCFVHLEHGNYVVSLSLTKRTSRFGSRSSAFAMKCPLVRAPPSGEHVMCDSDFIQVTRRIPTDSWNNELPWSLALRGKVVVALEDASLIRLSVETDGVNITVQGRRAEILSPEEVLDTPGTFLPLRLVSGHYSYSMEASCPTGSDSPVDETVLYIYKRRMGLVKRGGGDGEVLSLSAISVKQTDSFSVFESSDLVRIALNTSLILRTRRCMGPAGKQLIQPFFRVDAVLTFKETPHHLVWSLENLLPCTESSALSTAATETLVSSASSGSPTTPSAGRTAAAHSANPAFRWPASTVARLLPKAVDQGASSATQSGTSSRVSMLSKDTQGDLTGVTLATVGDISVIPSADTQGTQVLETSTEGFLLTASKNESNLHPFRRPPLIFGHSLLTTSSLGVELREQLSHTPISASEILSVGSEVKDSAAEPSTEMVIGVETSSTPPHVSEEGAGWLSRNTSMEGQAKHVTLFPESPGMITSGSSSLLGTASPRSEMDHSPKEDLLQKANSLLANLRPQLSISSAAWLLLKAVTQGANLTNVSGSMTPPNTRGNLAGVTFEILRGVSASSPTDTHGTQTLLTGGVALTIPKHVFDSLLSGRSPPIFDQPQITTSDPQAELRERPAYTTGSLSSDQMLRRVPTNNLLPSDYESASSLLLRKTLFPGQTEHDILSPEQQSTIVSDSRSHPSTPSVLDHSTLAGFLLKTYPILTKPTPPTSIKIDPDLKTLPLTPATLSEFHTTSKPSSRPSSGYRLLPTHTDTWQLTSTPVLLLSRLRAKGTSSSNPFATSPSLNGGTLGVQEHLGSLEAVIRSMSPYPDTHKILSPALSSRVEPHVVSNTILNYVAATSVTLGQRTEVMDTHQVESSWEPVMNKAEEGESAPSGIPPETERTEPNVMLPQPQSTLDSSLLTNSSSVVDHSVEKDVLQKSSPANLTYMAPNGMETKAFTQRPSQPSQLLLQP